MLDDNIPQPWRARTTLVLTLTLLAMGLGNIQRMPFLMGEYGGAPFFVSYLIALCLLSVPVLIAEVTVGSLGRGSPGLAIHWAASTANVDSRWRYLGVAQALLALLLAAAASFMAAWCLHWAGTLYSGTLASASAVDVAQAFTMRLDDRAAQLMPMLIVLAVSGAISAMGIRVGMGLLAWVCLPAVAVTLFGVLDFIFFYSDLRPVEDFVFARRPSDWSLEAFSQAVVAAGMTLGTGLGVGMALGAQAPPGLPWGRSVLAVAVLDTTFLIVTAVIISALLFGANVSPQGGLSALLVGVPYAFANLPLGETYGALFFFAMALISWSAVVVLYEPALMLLANEWGLGRVSGAILTSTITAVTAAIALFSADAPLLDVGYWVTRSFLPASILVTALFVGWVLPRPILRGELFREPAWLFRLWWWLLRWCAPICCVLWLILG